MVFLEIILDGEKNLIGRYKAQIDRQLDTLNNCKGLVLPKGLKSFTL